MIIQEQKLIKRMRFCEEKSDTRRIFADATSDSALSMAADEKFAASIIAFTERVDDLSTLTMVSYELLEGQTKRMGSEKSRKNLETVKESYSAFLGVVKEMSSPAQYVQETINDTTSKGNFDKLSKGRGTTAINAFINLFDDCLTAPPPGMIPCYEAMVKLGQKTLRVAQKEHSKIIRDNADLLKCAISARKQEMGITM
ncbi:MAG: hypothetical protein LBP75_00365 [Planctomycetota bacterium]|jgi:Trk K+ transport system NAD-binding subunit|nr:hypothetical protein [Planctomycetota bacterium]